ncbi:MAG: SDR family NAD(P)-dependent oxidoreductase [Phototrophicaceae bacterium]
MPNALIWGASGGMGQSLVRHLKAQGWQVFAAARQTDHIPEEADFTYEFDANSEDSFQQTVFFVAQETETLDLVIYTAGSVAYEKLDRMDYSAWQNTMNSNLNGAFLAAHHTLPLMPKGAHMVVIGVYTDHIRLPKMGAYAVAKAGLEELMQLLAKENRRHNFTLVRPGAVDTNFWEQVAFSKPDNIKSPDSVAQAIVEFIAADNSGILEL